MQVQERNGAPLEMKERNLISKMFKYLFCIQFLLITILELYLTVRGVVSPSDSPRFHPKKWYFPVLSSTACAGILGFAWQLFTGINPSRAFKAAFVASPLVTCAYGILLVSIGSKGSSAAAVFALSSAVFQSLYACWVRPRFQHASRILVVAIASHPPRIKTVAPLLIFICTFYSAFMVSGIGGATANGKKLDTLFIFLSLLSFAWTLTSSFCFLCGIATGSSCALVAGTWALLVHKSYATEVSLYTFSTGYLVVRTQILNLEELLIAACIIMERENLARNLNQAPFRRSFHIRRTKEKDEIFRAEVSNN